MKNVLMIACLMLGAFLIAVLCGADRAFSGRVGISAVFYFTGLSIPRSAEFRSEDTPQAPGTSPFVSPCKCSSLFGPIGSRSGETTLNAYPWCTVWQIMVASPAVNWLFFKARAKRHYLSHSLCASRSKIVA
jgi:hypothetical protein